MTVNGVYKALEQTEVSHTAHMNGFFNNCFRRIFKHNLVQLNIHLAYNQAIPNLGIYVKEMSTYVYQKIHRKVN